MSRALLGQARNVVRLRGVRFDAALRTFDEARVLAEIAWHALAEAMDAVTDAIEELDAARRRLVEEPEQSTARLALIQAAETALADAENALETAKRDAAEAELKLEDARAALLRARARRDAMTGRAATLARSVERVAEEQTAIETEERGGRARSGDRQ